MARSGPGKVGRPREKAISKWGVWKRQQRDLGSGKMRCSRCGKPKAELHHTGGTKNGRPSGRRVALCRACHTAAGNRGQR